MNEPPRRHDITIRVATEAGGSALITCTQMLALTGKARRWEPERLRLRIFVVVGRLAASGRRLRLRLAGHWPWTARITVATVRLQALPSG
jgi:Transposase DDE domain group 1